MCSLPEFTCLKNDTMVDNNTAQESLSFIENDATRERWDWVHRAISLAKRTNAQALEHAEAADGATTTGPRAVA